MAVSRSESASRSDPAAARTSGGSAAGSKGIFSSTSTRSRVLASTSGGIGRKSKRCTRERTVAGISRGSVVARMKTTWEGGSSSVLSNALKAASVS